MTAAGLALSVAAAVPLTVRRLRCSSSSGGAFTGLVVGPGGMPAACAFYTVTAS